ncbi:hypothetical protein JCM19233_6495 [Vibrio astriarenae]|nr:hypothetical protein JCM19233_6495 [Vibrio sp. C7]
MVIALDDPLADVSDLFVPLCEAEVALHVAQDDDEKRKWLIAR